MKAKKLVQHLTSDEKRRILESARIAHALPPKMENLIDEIIRYRESGESLPEGCLDDPADN